MLPYGMEPTNIVELTCKNGGFNDLKLGEIRNLKLFGVGPDDI